MPLRPGCPRCVLPLTETAAGRACPDHGVVPPLWRPEQASYDDFAALLAGGGTGRSGPSTVPTSFPTYLPWPMSPGWAVTDFGLVGDGDRVTASVTCSSGTSELDGPVDIFVIAEEAGVGLGARCAATVHTDPGADIGDGPPPVRVRVEAQSVPLWPVSTSGADDRFDRSVFAGEADGRWLWVVLRPASAMLLLREAWILRDATAAGPEMLELTFAGPPPAW